MLNYEFNNKQYLFLYNSFLCAFIKLNKMLVIQNS
jgi:hypothetical protein